MISPAAPSGLLDGAVRGAVGGLDRGGAVGQSWVVKRREWPLRFMGAQGESHSAFVEATTLRAAKGEKWLDQRPESSKLECVAIR